MLPYLDTGFLEVAKTWCDSRNCFLSSDLLFPLVDGYITNLKTKIPGTWHV
jgi:hypothetical protein